MPVRGPGSGSSWLDCICQLPESTHERAIWPMTPTTPPGLRDCTLVDSPADQPLGVLTWSAPCRIGPGSVMAMPRSTNWESSATVPPTLIESTGANGTAAHSPGTLSDAPASTTKHTREATRVLRPERGAARCMSLRSGRRQCSVWR